MSLDKSRHYLLKPSAHQDLEEIWRYTTENWSISQADKYIEALTSSFETIADMPSVARERAEFTPPVRIHPHDKHLIVYVVEQGQIEILRILGGAQNWQEILRIID